MSKIKAFGILKTRDSLMLCEYINNIKEDKEAKIALENYRKLTANIGKCAPQESIKYSNIMFQSFKKCKISGRNNLCFNGF